MTFFHCECNDYGFWPIEHRGDDMDDLLQLAVKAHGGLERWLEVKSLDFKLSVTGALFRLKGHPHGLEDITMHIDTRKPAASLTPYAHHAATGYFTPEKVWIEAPTGGVLEERTEPRASFAGHVRETPWDQLHRLYFISYAMWNYVTAPFLFTRPGFQVREVESHVENGETWRRLWVSFPAEVPTHCAEQVFYFNDKGLLQRLDYVTDVLGGVASHYCYDHQEFGGLVIPTLRRVVRRTPTGPALTGPTSVLLQLSNVGVS